jgi:MSHA biogenesis protein MshP
MFPIRLERLAAPPRRLACLASGTARGFGSRRARGFVLPTAVFLLVVMAALAAYMVRTFTLLRSDFNMSLQGAFAYQAALAGLEWGNYQALDPLYAWSASSSSLPACPATTTLTNLSGSMSGFSVTVSCTGGGASTYTEGNHLVAVYRFSSKASLGTASTAGYVERDAQSVVMLCKDPTAAGPAYKCH